MSVQALAPSPLWRPLTAHDAALINAVGAAIVPPVVEEAELLEALRIAEDVLPLVSRDHVLMRDLAVAAEALVAARGDRRRASAAGERNRWSSAHMAAGFALGALMRVRAAQAFGKATEGVAR